MATKNVTDENFEAEVLKTLGGFALDIWRGKDAKTP